MLSSHDQLTLKTLLNIAQQVGHGEVTLVIKGGLIRFVRLSLECDLCRPSPMLRVLQEQDDY